MSRLVRAAGAVPLLGVVAFCVFGFLAAPEVPEAAGFWRLVYSAVGAAALAGAGWMAWPRRARA
jgi:hypothetical protein